MAHLVRRIGIRLKENDYLILKRVSEARGEDISDFVRRAIKYSLAQLSYYSPEEKRALGIQEPQSPKVEPSTSSEVSTNG